MKAIFTESRGNARQPDNKELVETLNIVGKMKGYDGKLTLQTIATARFYMGRSSQASTVYCCLWVHGEKSTSGKGQAGGWGHHRTSQALANAISSAGIELWGDQYGQDNSRARIKKKAYIGGCGDSAMRDAMLAIARAAGGKGQLLDVRN